MLQYRWHLFFRAQRFQWLWATVLLWLGMSALGARLLPGMWGFTHTGPLFIPHFYLTIASIFFFIDDCSKTEDKKFWSAGEYAGLTLFAVSNVVMTLAFVFLAGVVYFILPLAGSVFAWVALLKIYALKPIYWFVLQGVFDAGVLSAPRGRVQAVCLSFQYAADVGRLDGCRRDAGCGCRCIDF